MQLVWLCLAFVSWIGCVSAAGKRLIFPHMKNNGDTEFGNNCDDCYREADIQYKYRFYGNDYTRIFVADNGYMTFASPYTWYNPVFTSAFNGPIMIAPYFSDVYLPLKLRASHIWYRETTDQTLLDRAYNVIKGHFLNCGGPEFDPKALFILTYQRIGSYCEAVGCCMTDCSVPGKRDVSDVQSPQQVLKREKENLPFTKSDDDDYSRNCYQLVLATDNNGTTFAINNIDIIEWSCCHHHNKLLVNAGDGVGFFMHPDPSAAGLTGATNVLKPDGRWVYKVSGTKAKNPECEDVGT